MLLRTWSVGSPHEYCIHFTSQKWLFFPPIKIPTATSHGIKRKIMEILMFPSQFFLVVGLTLSWVKLMVQKNMGRLPLGKRWCKKRSCIYCGDWFVSFLEILMCGIADVVFPDWFFLFCFIYLRRGEEKMLVPCMLKRGRKEGKKIIS